MCRIYNNNKNNNMKAIPSTSIDYERSTQTNTLGYQAAVLRSLRAANVKFLRYAILDSFNTVRSKTVPIDHALRILKRGDDPFANPVSIAEVCYAGLPPSADVPVEGAGLTAKNVLALRPDFATLRVLPYSPSTAMVMCTSHDQRTGELSPLCTRGLLEKAMQRGRDELGVEFTVGAELEFQLYRLGSDGDELRPVDSSTFANSATLNEQEEFIADVYEKITQQDINVELIHSESAPGQLEVVLGYENALQIADNIFYAKETISAVAKQHGMKALFLPKTSMMTAGNGLHFHYGFREVGSSSNAFGDESTLTGISRRGGAFMEGILQSLPALLSFTLPTNNSFRRVGPGCWTGSTVSWSTEDKESPLRVCLDLNSGGVSNVELKLSDATANPYLALAMVLAAGSEGMRNDLTLRPMNEGGSHDALPESLTASLDALKSNNSLLDTLGGSLSKAYIAVRESEAATEQSLEEEVRNALMKS